MPSPYKAPPCELQANTAQVRRVDSYQTVLSLYRWIGVGRRRKTFLAEPLRTLPGSRVLLHFCCPDPREQPSTLGIRGCAGGRARRAWVAAAKSTAATARSATAPTGAGARRRFPLWSASGRRRSESFRNWPPRDAQHGQRELRRAPGHGGRAALHHRHESRLQEQLDAGLQKLHEKSGTGGTP